MRGEGRSGSREGRSGSRTPVTALRSRARGIVRQGVAFHGRPRARQRPAATRLRGARERRPQRGARRASVARRRRRPRTALRGGAVRRVRVALAVERRAGAFRGLAAARAARERRSALERLRAASVTRVRRDVARVASARGRVGARALRVLAVRVDADPAVVAVSVVGARVGGRADAVPAAALALLSGLAVRGGFAVPWTGVTGRDDASGHRGREQEDDGASERSHQNAPSTRRPPTPSETDRTPVAPPVFTGASDGRKTYDAMKPAPPTPTPIHPSAFASASAL